MTPLGKIIKEERERQGLSRSKLSRMANCSCEPKESAPCEAVISAFQENNISILKKSEYTAKVATMYGKNESGGAYFVGGVYTSSNQAAEGMTGMSISIYKGEQFLSRASIDITEGTLSPDFAAKSVIKTLLNKKSESKTR